MLGFPQKEKLLETCGQTGVFSDQILRLRPLNDTDCSALFILFIAIRAKPVFIFVTAVATAMGHRYENACAGWAIGPSPPLSLVLWPFRAKPVFTLCHGGGNRHESL
jgi:hypothetical protein